jgi:carbonic anhydrase/acetyltransferase-like protein (isoleucine patch superfamily)
MVMGCGEIIEYNGKKPVIGKNVFIDPAARIMGDVKLGDNVVVLFGSIIRGDDESVTIGRNTVVLELSLIEAPKNNPVIIGEEVLISHGAIVHGAKIGDRSLIGIGARVLDGAVVGEESIVAAGAVVTPGKVVPTRTIVAGVPAKPLRKVTDEDLERAREELKAVHRKAAYYRRIFGCR